VINREELDWAIDKVIGVLTGDRVLQATSRVTTTIPPVA